MSGRGMTLRLSEFLIRRAVRRLPAENRDEWFKTFAGELPAILRDPAIRSAFRRHARMLLCAADSFRGVWGLRGSPARRPRSPVNILAHVFGVGGIDFGRVGGILGLVSGILGLAVGILGVVSGVLGVVGGVLGVVTSGLLGVVGGGVLGVVVGGAVGAVGTGIFFRDWNFRGSFSVLIRRAAGPDAGPAASSLTATASWRIMRVASRLIPRAAGRRWRGSGELPVRGLERASAPGHPGLPPHRASGDRGELDRCPDPADPAHPQRADGQAEQCQRRSPQLTGLGGGMIQIPGQPSAQPPSGLARRPPRTGRIKII